MGLDGLAELPEFCTYIGNAPDLVYLKGLFSRRRRVSCRRLG